MLQPTLTVNEAAQFLKLKPRTIREWIAHGRLRAQKIGRAYVIPEAEVSRIISPPATVKSQPGDPERAARIAAMRGSLKGTGASATLEELRDRDAENRARFLREFGRK